MPSPTEIAAVTLVVGDEDFLISRALDDLRSAARSRDADVETYEYDAGEVDAVDLVQVLSPSLFGSRRHVVVRSAQDLTAELTAGVLPLLLSPEPDTTVVIQHLGAAKGKAVLEATRRVKPAEIGCTKLSRPEERAQFVRSEVRRFGGRITAGAAETVLEAVGSDLREISAALGQLIGDTGGDIDEAAVLAYHRGRAEVTGFAVADQAVIGEVGRALTNLRWAVNSGVPLVVIADALADGVRSVARVAAAGNGDPFALAQVLGMPPWKIKRARAQSRGWTDTGLREALVRVATLNAEVKGAAVDPEYAIEAAIRSVAGARGAR